MEETLAKRGKKKNTKKEKATFCYLTLRYLNQAHTIARTTAIPSFWPRHELDQVGVQNRFNLHLLTEIHHLPYFQLETFGPVLTWLWKAVGCSSFSECLRRGDTYGHPCSGKKQNPTIIISGPFLGFTEHPGYFSGLSGKTCYRSWTISSARARKLSMPCFLCSLHISSNVSDSSIGMTTANNWPDVKSHCQRCWGRTHFSLTDSSQF